MTSLKVWCVLASKCQSWVVKCLANDWGHSWKADDFNVGIRMTSLPVFRQMFAYSSLASIHPTLVKWFAFGSHLLHTHHIFLPDTSQFCRRQRWSWARIVYWRIFFPFFAVTPNCSRNLAISVLSHSRATGDRVIFFWHAFTFEKWLWLQVCSISCKKKVRKEKNNIGVFRLENVENSQRKRK